MTTLFDARLNEFQGALDQIANASVTDVRTVGATLSATGQVFLDLNGKATCAFDIRIAASATATLIFEGTVDGSNYYQIPAFTSSSPSGTLSGLTAESYVMSLALSAQTLIATFLVESSGWRQVRCRVSAYTSGSITINARASCSDSLIYMRPLPALLNASTAPAVNTAGTITLPAAGTGLFHYITNFQCQVAMNPATAQTGAATVFVTTTNISNTPSWAVPIAGNAAASTGGLGAAHIKIAEERWVNPLKSSVANTATTFVCPAPGAACQLRANVQYYVGA